MGLNFTLTQGVNIPGPIVGTENQSAMTISVWIRANALPPATDNQTYLIYAGGGGATRFGIQARGANPGSIRINARALDADALTSFETTSVTALVPGTWQHIVGIVNYAGAAGLIYINAVNFLAPALGGVTAFGAAATQNTPSTNAKVGINVLNNTSEFMNGIIEDARLYSGVLGPDVISTIYAAQGKDGITQNLIHRFQLKDKGKNQPVIQLAPFNGGKDRQIGVVSVGSLNFGDTLPTTRKRPRMPIGFHL